MFKKVCLLIPLLVIFSAIQSYAQENEEMVFSGIPVVKISEGGNSRVAEELKGTKALEAECAITKIGDKYFWKTRNNVNCFLFEVVLL